MNRFHAISLAFLAAFGVAAQGSVGTRITLDAGSFSFDSYEGALVLPHRKAEPPEILKAMIPSVSRDGSVTTVKRGEGGVWTISRAAPGIYSFFVGNPDAGPGFEWKGSLKVTVDSSTGALDFVPPSKSGAVWHVFDLDGSSGEVIPVNLIYPFSRMAWGYVRDAAVRGPDGNAAPLEGARVELRSKATREVVDSILTGKNGFYMLVAPDGVDFDVTFTKKGYIQVDEFARFMVNEYPLRIDAAMSSLLLKAQYRAVLTWGKAPRDLDSHLSGPIPGGGSFHVSYRAMRDYATRHNLDVDCMSGIGPETITITRLDPGKYSYSVHDYTNGQSASSSALSESKPVVRLYREKELVGTFECPEGIPGTVWRVFEIDGKTGEIRAVNELSFQSDPAAVR